MGVNMTGVVMVGADIGYQYIKDYNERADDDDAFYDAFEAEYGIRQATEGKFVVIPDGMGGKTCHVGFLVAKANLDNGENLKAEIDPDRLNILINAARMAVLDHMDIKIEPKLFVFTHYT